MWAVWRDCVRCLWKERWPEEWLNPAMLQVLNQAEGWEFLYEQGLGLEWDWTF